MGQGDPGHAGENGGRLRRDCGAGQGEDDEMGRSLDPGIRHRELRPFCRRGTSHPHQAVKCWRSFLRGREDRHREEVCLGASPPSTSRATLCSPGPGGGWAPFPWSLHPRAPRHAVAPAPNGTHRHLCLKVLEGPTCLEVLAGKLQPGVVPGDSGQVSPLCPEGPG